jgi:D-3-phosphoglycerate dehydrogenase
MYMQKYNLAITIRSFNLNESVYRRLEPFFHITYINSQGNRLKEQDVITAIQNADAVIAGTEPFSLTVIRNSPRLKWISRVGVGTDSIDGSEAKDRRIRIAITSASAIQPVAEHTIALMLCCLKRIYEYNNSMKDGDTTLKSSGLLQKKTIGIIGLGRIGFRVGEILSGFGAQVQFFDPGLRFSPPATWHRAGTLGELLSQADIITLHTPAQEKNVPLLNQATLETCRDGVIIINTARGSLIDEMALDAALRSGKVAGAGLDVFVNEPYTGPLLRFPQVVATPHVASNSRESREEMEAEAISNLITFVKEGSA